ncbi:Heavy metal-associated isoprenylated plant protein 20 [Zea mays]|uniref:Heavy metal-associated isoprenylated plant protein 20 n=1 Tax=Zea mays TaxID=4577 RepID=A0A3L6FNX9_MAIZE|nr:Heavy metal-associated isoprenylated plant protein 20 [Zea mays]
MQPKSICIYRSLLWESFVWFRNIALLASLPRDSCSETLIKNRPSLASLVITIRFVSVSVGTMDEENDGSTQSHTVCFFLSSAKSITVEMKVYMHCDACERKVRRTISKVEGVGTVEVDREENKVTVTGDFEPEKVVRKIRKKTGKKAEILVPEENEEDEGNGEETYVPYPLLYPDADIPDEFQTYRPERWNFHYFDDENSQACTVM